MTGLGSDDVPSIVRVCQTVMTLQPEKSYCLAGIQNVNDIP